MTQNINEKTLSGSNEVRDGSHDFDFLIGKWKVHHKKLTKPLIGSDLWHEFKGESIVRSIWGDGDNIDEISGDSPKGTIRGITLRLYDRNSRQWRIHWANMATGILEVPMIGEFKDGRGEFYDQELFEGKAIFVRFIWTVLGKDSCKWEQAFSQNGGKTWETNWIMDFTRLTESPNR